MTRFTRNGELDLVAALVRDESSLWSKLTLSSVHSTVARGCAAPLRGLYQQLLNE